MKTITSFVYEGLIFIPIRQLNKNESDFFEVSKRINDIKITPKNWDYDKFYKVAKEHGAGHIDLFEVNGITVIPSARVLFEYR